MTSIPWTPDDDDARHLLDERIESYDVDPTAMTWWERLLNWLNDATSLSVDAAGAGGVILQVLLVLAVVILIWLLIRYFRPSVSATHQDHANHLADPTVDAQQYWQTAQQYLADDAFDQAYLLAFRFLVRSTSDRQLVDVTPSTTATTFGWSLGAVFPAHRDAIDDAATQFNAISYGGAKPSRADVETVMELAQTLTVAPPLSDSAQHDPARLMPR